MELEKPTQKDIEIGLDFLIKKIIEQPNVKHFAKLSKSISLFRLSGYDIKHHIEIYDKLYDFYISKTSDLCPFKELPNQFQIDNCKDCDGKGMYNHNGINLFCSKYEKRE
jgi:hypothetical protein